MCAFECMCTCVRQYHVLYRLNAAQMTICQYRHALLNYKDRISTYEVNITLFTNNYERLLYVLMSVPLGCSPCPPLVLILHFFRFSLCLCMLVVGNLIWDSVCYVCMYVLFRRLCG